MATMTSGRIPRRRPIANGDAYITNTIAWLVPSTPAVTCQPGYTGTQLTVPEHLREGYTGATLNMWITAGWAVGTTCARG